MNEPKARSQKNVDEIHQAISRVQAGQGKVSISTVAKLARVTTALIHNTHAHTKHAELKAPSATSPKPQLQGFSFVWCGRLHAGHTVQNLAPPATWWLHDLKKKNSATFLIAGFPLFTW